MVPKTGRPEFRRARYGIGYRVCMRTEAEEKTVAETDAFLSAEEIIAGVGLFGKRGESIRAWTHAPTIKFGQNCG